MLKARKLYFDLWLTHDFDGSGREDAHVTGRIIPGYPATGPTYDCGGTPAESPELDDVKIFRVIDGKEVEVEDGDGEIASALWDDIFEKAAESE